MALYLVHQKHFDGALSTSKKVLYVTFSVFSLEIRALLIKTYLSVLGKHVTPI